MSNVSLNLEENLMVDEGFLIFKVKLEHMVNCGGEREWKIGVPPLYVLPKSLGLALFRARISMQPYWMYCV